MHSEEYSRERADALVVKMLTVMEESAGTDGERVFALCAVLETLGRLMHGGTAESKEELEAEFKTSPSWPLAIILISHLPGTMLKMFVAEATDSTKNEQAWEQFLAKEFAK